MMKSLTSELQRRKPENRRIQGLFSSRNTEENFWLLKARIVLAVFSEKSTKITEKTWRKNKKFRKNWKEKNKN